MKRKKKKSNLKIRPLIIAVLSLGAVAYYAISRLPKLTPTPIGINEIAPLSASVTLSLPTTISTVPGSLSLADITIDTGGARVSAVQVELSYDPSLLSAVTLTQGDFLTSKLGNPKVQNGKISFVYVVPTGSSGASGVGKLATIQFKSGNSPSQITFGNNTMVAAIGSNANMLKGAIGANVVSGSSTPVALTPPTLTDIRPAPALASPKPAPTSKPNSPSASVQTTAVPSARVFDETGNFDYSKPVAGAPLGTPIPAGTDSAFARFLAKIKALLGGAQNAQN